MPAPFSLPSSLIGRVDELMRQVAAEEVLPRFRRLAAHEVLEKTPGELVTVADRAAELALIPLLSALLPGSRVVGEEGVAANPDLLLGLDEGDVWLVDPVDGTANFVDGNPMFGVMVALLRGGETTHSWILFPVTGELAAAERGAGAWFKGERLQASDIAPALGDTRGIIKNRFLPEALRPGIEARSGRVGRVAGTNCAAGDYVALTRGDAAGPQFCLYWRTLPWDHAPGALFLNEAGGRAARLDGSPYRAGDGRLGLLSAHNAQLWETVHAGLIDQLP